jgi:hypothetical protein
VKNRNNVLSISPPIIISSKYDKNKDEMDRVCSTNVCEGGYDYDVDGNSYKNVGLTSRQQPIYGS